MTNLEAIQSVVSGYPLSANTYQRVLTDRGLTASDIYTGRTMAFELAEADIYKTLVNAANIQEGGFQISITDKSNLIKLANSIYAKWGEPLMGTATPTVSDASSAW